MKKARELFKTIGQKDVRGQATLLPACEESTKS
jgi:hypothetical protein